MVWERLSENLKGLNKEGINNVLKMSVMNDH